MYSGTTLSNYSGNILGVHQKIDRIAYRVLGDATGLKCFPPRKDVIYFEGKNGPDGIKSKSPAQDEPWHFIDPFDPGDTGLLSVIMNHYDNLVAALKDQNEERAAFEASWLSHAVVDGLTPAHHYPYEEKMMEMRKGESMDTRNSIKEKLVMKGDTPGEKLKNNWLMWGFKGLMISHSAFEFGVAAIAAPFVFSQVELDKQKIAKAKKLGFREYFLRHLREVALWHMYEDYNRYGWNWSLSKRARDDLMPIMIDTVSMAWYLAMHEAGVTARKGSKK